MPENITTLSEQEKQWIITHRFARSTDGKEVQIYPMGAERHLSSILNRTRQSSYAIYDDINGKDVLVIPGYANSSFLFALAGAKSVTAYDKDPITIAWMKVFKKYYHYREYNAQGKPYSSIGEIMEALTAWYPPLIPMPKGTISNILYWILHPNALRRSYIHYMIALAVRAVKEVPQNNFELEHPIQFFAGTVENVTEHYDTVFVPYLLGVRNGIEDEANVVLFIKQLFEIIPNGHVIVTPSRSVREFHVVGARYLDTLSYQGLQEIPALKNYLKDEDPHWFKNQGIVVFAAK